MNQHLTDGIILSRINYGEADRIVKLLTPQGKLSLLARGVRRPKSKLAGGIELFSVSSLTYIQGRGDLGTLISARLERHYGSIVSNLERVQLGYDLIKLLDRATEDVSDSDYFELLQHTFGALNDNTVDLVLIRIWFNAQLLRLAGHSPNLQTDTDGTKLVVDGRYSFDFDSVAFTVNPHGKFNAAKIKFLRLLFADTTPQVLNQISGITELIQTSMPLIQTMLTAYIRI